MKFVVPLLLALAAPSVSGFAPSTGSSTATTSTQLSLEAMELKGYYTAKFTEEQVKEMIPPESGFDPLGFSKTNAGLFFMREAEIKHARLAMLAAAGWPVAEIFDRPLAKAFEMDAVLDSADRTPSLLNGGLDKVSPFFWAAVLTAGAFIDIYQINKANEAGEGYFPGNLGIDPFNLYPKDREGQLQMQLKEIKNGRLAMIAITAFAFQEYVSSTGVIDETPAFFKPFFMG